MLRSSTMDQFDHESFGVSRTSFSSPAWLKTTTVQTIPTIKFEYNRAKRVLSRIGNPRNRDEIDLFEISDLEKVVDRAMELERENEALRIALQRQIE